MEKIKGLILKNTFENQCIKELKDLSDSYMKRTRVIFKNGHQLSIIQGMYSYGGDQGLFEIAIYDKDGNFTREYTEKEDYGDDVIGYCTKEKVCKYIEKIGMLR